MPPSERREQTVPEALKYFYGANELGRMPEGLKISTFVKRILETGLDLPNAYDYGTICLLAVYLPDPVLDVLDPDQVSPENREVWNSRRESLREWILRERTNRDGIYRNLLTFCQSRRRDFDDRDEYKLRVAIDRFAADPDYVALLRRAQRQEERSEERRLAEAREAVPQYAELERATVMLEKARAEQEAKAMRAASINGSHLSEYEESVRMADRADSSVELAFARLSFQEVIAARGSGGLTTALAASVGILVLFVLDVVPPAFAAETTFGAGAKTSFVPPLGLPLSIWILMVTGFYLLLLVVIGISIYAGYFAEKKNIKAAAFADGFGKLALGVFLGKVSGI
jgi:hypothetical protein